MCCVLLFMVFVLIFNFNLKRYKFVLSFVWFSIFCLSFLILVVNDYYLTILHLGLLAIRPPFWTTDNCPMSIECDHVTCWVFEPMIVFIFAFLLFVWNPQSSRAKFLLTFNHFPDKQFPMYKHFWWLPFFSYVLLFPFLLHRHSI